MVYQKGNGCGSRIAGPILMGGILLGCAAYALRPEPPAEERFTEPFLYGQQFEYRPENLYDTPELSLDLEELNAAIELTPDTRTTRNTP